MRDAHFIEQAVTAGWSAPEVFSALEEVIHNQRLAYARPGPARHADRDRSPTMGGSESRRVRSRMEWRTGGDRMNRYEWPPARWDTTA